MKRSRSGTARPADKPPLSAIVLMVALAIVLAFSASLIFGLRRADEPSVTAKPVVNPPSPTTAVYDTRRAKVEVLNGSGKQGLAKLATEQLRDAGYDVVQFGNAPKTTPTSYVIDRVGKLQVAAAVGREIGITSSRTQIDTTRFVDATVVLGRDWPPLKSAPAATKRTWKDRLRRR